MEDRPNQPAVLRRKVKRLEALLEAEKIAHAKTFEHYRENLWELVEVKQHLKRIQEAVENKEQT